MSPRRPLPPAAHRAVMALAGWTCALVTVVPDPTRPVLTTAGLAAAAVLVAAAGGWRAAGTLAVGSVTVAVLLAAVLDASDRRPVQVVAAAALLLVMVSALGRAETAPGPAAVAVWSAPWRSRAVPVGLALGASVLVAHTAARGVVPSVGLVLAGLGAAVTALVVATRAHRG